MSTAPTSGAHRTHYFPPPADPAQAPHGLLLVAALAAVTLGLGVLFALLLHVGFPVKAEAATVRTPTLAATPLESACLAHLTRSAD